MLDKTYSPAEIEARWYAHWEASGAFKAGSRPAAAPFVIVIPPPNVTGSLHMGHALDNTLQDVLVRYHRLLGKDVLWQPGVDHAGIATQMVVERNLASQDLTREGLGREAFLAHVWEWKAQSGGTIARQLRRLGASCDWSRERFTMDEGFSEAVLKVFVALYRQGLLYRDKRLVNWDPKLETAISDLEVEQREVAGQFWHLRYPFADGSGHVVVATTRPETMLADMAVAVHPEDARYRALIGKDIAHPITGRRLKLVADPWADPELGSGAVKITPGHDFNDFEVGKRIGIAPALMLNMFDAKARVAQTSDGLIPEKFIGLDRYEARRQVVAEMTALGLVEAVEDKAIQMPHGDRSGVVIEPWLTDQWYVDAATLAKPAIAAVKEGRTRFVPATWEKTYFNWMENIQPWCVSRQLWWGHQIPAWYDEAGNVYVAHSEEEAQAQAGAGTRLTRDEDVLDTWFSSALWPFATMGWPDEAQAARLGLAKYYPNSVLVTGFDIIFFWVARMMMMGLHFMKEVPFKTVYIHALVRDEAGQKMSKSRGNVVDPLRLIERYGADALRFTLAAMETQGRDIKLATARVEGYRNFGTKLWNAARFCQMNGIAGASRQAPPKATLGINKWALSETARAIEAVSRGLDEFRYADAANAIYQFVWASFCDWYLELIKPVLQGEDGADRKETRLVAGWVLDQILILLHPFMPFITEELWHAMAQRRDGDLITAPWPLLSLAQDCPEREEIDWLIRVISAVRAARAEVNLSPAAMASCFLLQRNEKTQALAAKYQAALSRLARIEWHAEKPDASLKDALQVIVDEDTFILGMTGLLDFEAERARLAKAIDKVDRQVLSLSGRLANEAFLAKAPAEVVEEGRAKLAAAQGEAAKLRQALARLG
ncbi:MAG: valine--tRNA ligase [Pseudomonadota bacterium]